MTLPNADAILMGLVERLRLPTSPNPTPWPCDPDRVSFVHVLPLQGAISQTSEVGQDAALRSREVLRHLLPLVMNELSVFAAALHKHCPDDALSGDRSHAAVLEAVKELTSNTIRPYRDVARRYFAATKDDDEKGYRNALPHFQVAEAELREDRIRMLKHVLAFAHKSTLFPEIRAMGKKNWERPWENLVISTLYPHTTVGKQELGPVVSLPEFDGVVAGLQSMLSTGFEGELRDVVPLPTWLGNGAAASQRRKPMDHFDVAKFLGSMTASEAIKGRAAAAKLRRQQEAEARARQQALEEEEADADGESEPEAEEEELPGSHVPEQGAAASPPNAADAIMATAAQDEHAALPEAAMEVVSAAPDAPPVPR